MRLPMFLICAALAASTAPAAAAAPAIADPICPRAVPKLVAFGDATASKDAAKIASAAKDAAQAYEICTGEALTAKGVAVEPTVNYDKTRNAQYLVVQGRALAAGGNAAQAATAFKDARKLAEEVATWQPESQTWHASNSLGPGASAQRNSGPLAPDDVPGRAEGNSSARNTDRNGSRYRAAAIDIRTACDEELAKLQGAVKN